MSEHNKEEENKKNQINHNENLSNNNEKSIEKENANDILENETEKEEMNFDSIDFNINPFNSNDEKKEEKSDESDEFVLEEKELKNIQYNKFHTSNDLIKIDPFQEEEPNEIELDKNKIQDNDKNNNLKDDNNIFSSNNSINYNVQNNEIKDFSSINDNSNSRKSYNNSKNINLDIGANSFIPKNPNRSNNNINNFFMTKGRPSWICSFCHNFNFESKQNIIYFNYFYRWRNM